jgi:glucans biosynthesis protein C
MAAPQSLKRLHSLDALRAAMMLLGLVLHSGVSYVTHPVPEAWFYQDPQTSVAFDWVVFIIHLFRMPTFFVMCGFFAAFLYYREGVAGFLAHRTRRVLLPLVVGWLIAFPLIRAGFIFAQSGGGRDGFERALAGITSTPYATPLLGHLWFLYFLFIFCVAACVIVPIVERLPQSIRSRLVATFGSLAPGAAGCLACAVVSAVSMLPMSKPALDTSLTFIPMARVLVAYTVFFIFGWLLFLRQDVVTAFGRHPWRYCAAGLTASVAYMIILVGRPFGDGWGFHGPAIVVGGLAMWLLIYGVTGLFVRYFEQPRPVQRYLSDASYWMYLVHLPFVIWFQGAMASWPVSPLVKFAITLSGVTLVTVLSYHYLVRATPIGQFLNGRRFERALPPLTPQSARA